MERAFTVPSQKLSLCTAGPGCDLAKYGRAAIDTGAVTVEPTNTVKALGALFGMHLNMVAQVNNIIKTCNYYIRKIFRVSKKISMEACHAAVQALVIMETAIVMSSLVGYHSTRAKS